MTHINKFHHRKTIRLKGYDYSQSGFYYVTVYTQNRECLLGEIIDRKMVLNEIGEIVDKWWLEIPKRFNGIKLDKYQLMPNHIHGIIIINNRDNGRENRDNGRENRAPTLGKIIAYFKYQSTKQINQYLVGAGIIPPSGIIPSSGVTSSESIIPNNKKIFQRNYYEHIIRNENELNAIRQYIIDNPKNWAKDENNPNLI